MDEEGRADAARRGEAKLRTDVATHGWHVLKVAEDAEGPGFAYSIRLFHTFAHPELVIVGLPLELMHRLINDVGELIRAGRRFEDGASSEDVLEGCPVRFRAVPQIQYPHYFGWARWFYEGDAFPVLQVVYPDRSHRWPGEGGVSDGFRWQQPVLANDGIPPWASRPAG